MDTQVTQNPLTLPTVIPLAANLPVGLEDAKMLGVGEQRKHSPDLRPSPPPSLLDKSIIEFPARDCTSFWGLFCLLYSFPADL